ncbi:MAG: hypothetical protein OXK78_04255 [Caldilineaceae bacterium]|nr:hypothetical protein [Caldilineaceae bacterium]
MSIPHKDRVPYTKIPIATPGELAAALRAKGYPVREQPGRRWPVHTTTALCHGGDSPDKLGLCFDADSRRWAGKCLTGGCDSRAILHSVQAATELWLCRCDACWSAWRAREVFAQPQTATSGHRRAETPPVGLQHSAGPGKRTGGDTAAYAARLWAAAYASTGQAPEHHPASRWLAGKGEAGLWPPGVRLPETVRWLPKGKMPAGKGVRSDSRAAGALVMAMARPEAPLADPRKVHLVAIDADGRKAQHWTGDRGDKRTFGSDASAYGLLWRVRPGTGAGASHLHVCEGLADGLRILRYAPEPAVVAVCAGTGYGRIEAGWFASVTLWPDADDAGVGAARKAAQRWADQGYDVRIKQLAAGHDPASAPLRERAEDGQTG